MRRMRLKKKASIITAALVMVASLIYFGEQAIGASFSGSTLVSATIPGAASISVPPTLTLNVLPIGSTQSTVLTPITVQSNEDSWDVSVTKNRDLTSVGGDVIDSARLVYTSTTTNGTGVNTQTQFQLTPTAVVSPPTTATSGATISVTYFLTTLFTDPPGTYTATHTYTLTIP